MNEVMTRARQFLGGMILPFADADNLWKALKGSGEIALARLVLAQVREGRGLLDGLPAERTIRQELCRQEALLTSMDAELSAATRHDRALELLAGEFHLGDDALTGDGETLGIAGGIYKRRWFELGRSGDLKQAAELYGRGAQGPLGDDAYPHIDAAFIEDLLAAGGDDPGVRRDRARRWREQIVAGLPRTNKWFTAATRAEAFFGLGRYVEARDELLAATGRPAPWELETTARQLATLAHLRVERPLGDPEVRAVFDALLPGAADGMRSAFVGKVGLALSGGGLRASFYHLGLLARLAELDVLRHVDVLSCVSGGSIAGACYWLALRHLLIDRRPGGRDDYVALVGRLIQHFEAAVAQDLRRQVQPSKGRLMWRLLHGAKGALDPETTAEALERLFYRPLMPGEGPLFMHELAFDPADHDRQLTGAEHFHPGSHNWLRAHKVPVLVLNATTINTGHAWQFTPTWMGESPWSIHEAADSVPRLEWAWYAPDAGWRVRLGQAVAASACVPVVFAPLRMHDAYDGVEVALVDGGVHDNQGTVSLLAHGCTVLLVSDAAGQLLLERTPPGGVKGLASHALRSMDTLMERVRLANYADLAARRQSGLLRGLMFVHMKAGLDSDPIRWRFSTQSYELRRSPLSPSGVRRDFQQALAELRTDLDRFSLDEGRALMACGYQMAKTAVQRDLTGLRELWEESATEAWPFAEHLAEITSTEPATLRGSALLTALRSGSRVAP